MEGCGGGFSLCLFVDCLFFNVGILCLRYLYGSSDFDSIYVVNRRSRMLKMGRGREGIG